MYKCEVWMPKHDKVNLNDDVDDDALRREERKRLLGEHAHLLERVHQERIEFPPTISPRQAIELLTNGSCGD